MKLGLLIFLWALLLGADPSALVAGSVRDQRGTPIPGAKVVLLAGSGEVGRGVTASDGTFAIPGSGDRVRITCAYCSPTGASVAADGTVVALVRRYDAPRIQGPSAYDVAHLPAAQAASLFTLVPFVVRNESSRAIPGVTLRDRNAGYDGLLQLNGVADYDTAGATTTYDTLPQGDAGAINVYRVDQAYRYGSYAQAGTFSFSNDDGDSHAAYGNNALLRAHVDGNLGYADAAYSDWSYGDRRQRATVDADATTAGVLYDANLSTGSAQANPGGISALFSSFSSARIGAQTRGSTDAFATLTLDRGSYAYTSQRFPNDATWSDFEFNAGITSHAALAPFALIDARSTSGSYFSNATAPDRAAGALDLNRGVAGVRYTSSTVDATLAYGSGSGAYHGVALPSGTQPISENDATFSIDAHPSDHWLIHGSTSTGYTLQSLLGMYLTGSTPYALPVERSNTNELTLTYADTSRLTTSVTTLSWHGASGISTSSSGASIGWQIAPHVAVRTWLLGIRGSAQLPALVGSSWLTYDNEGHFRADVIWARDLLDGAMNGHLDGTISGTLSPRLNWFVASTEQNSHRTVSVGIQTFFTH